MGKSKIMNHMLKGKVVKFKGAQPRYYKIIDGDIFYKDFKFEEWKKSKAKESAFDDSFNWEYEIVK